jgi:putative copper resistance protein D
MVAAPLFALATPLELLARTSARGATFVASKPMTLLLHPVVAFAVYAAFIPATHLSGLFNTMLTTTWFHHAEQVGFLVIGYLFFRQAFGLEEGTSLHPGLRVVFIMAAVPVDTITGLALAMSGHNPFPAYAQMDRMGAMPILSDLHLGGALMWIGGDTLMLLAVIPLVARWVAYETRNTKRIDEELDRLGL